MGYGQSAGSLPTVKGIDDEEHKEQTDSYQRPKVALLRQGGLLFGNGMFLLLRLVDGSQLSSSVLLVPDEGRVESIANLICCSQRLNGMFRLTQNLVFHLQIAANLLKGDALAGSCQQGVNIGTKLHSLLVVAFVLQEDDAMHLATEGVGVVRTHIFLVSFSGLFLLVLLLVEFHERPIEFA